MVTDVVAAVFKRNGKILVARRSSGRLAGKWEFPGGKVEHGESARQALKREIKEEFGIQIEVGPFLAESLFRINGDPFRLLVFHAATGTLDLIPTDHDRIDWVEPARLTSYDLAEPDIPIAIRLSKASD